MSKLILNIRVLAGMDIQQFVIPAQPGTLQIKPGPFGQGHQISIKDVAGENRIWYAHELAGLYFEE